MVATSELVTVIYTSHVLVVQGYTEGTVDVNSGAILLSLFYSGRSVGVVSVFATLTTYLSMK